MTTQLPDPFAQQPGENLPGQPPQGAYPPSSLPEPAQELPPTMPPPGGQPIPQFLQNLTGAHTVEEFQQMSARAVRQQAQPSRYSRSPLMGAIFILVGLVVFFFMGQTASIDCVHSESTTANCTLHSRFLGLVSLDEKQVDGIRSATVAKSCNSKGSCTYRVELAKGAGSIPLTDYYDSDLGSKQDAAQKINAFLNSEDQRLSVNTGGFSLLLLFPLVFVAVGIFVAIVPTRSSTNIRFR